MPGLLSGKTLRSGGSGGFLDLRNAMPQLPPTPTTATGFTIVTDAQLNTTYRSSLGYLAFSDGSITNQLEGYDIVLNATGTSVVLVTGTADSTSTDTGSLTVRGGIGVAKGMYIGEDIHVNGLTIGKGDGLSSSPGFHGYNNVVMTGGPAVEPPDDLLDGQENIVIGWGAMGGFTTVNRSIAVGTNALSSGSNYRGNIAIGDNSLLNAGTKPASLYQSVTAASNTDPVTLTIPGNSYLIGSGLELYNMYGMDSLSGQTVYAFPRQIFSAYLGRTTTIDAGGNFSTTIDAVFSQNTDIIAYYTSQFVNYLRFQIQNDDGTWSNIIQDLSTTSTSIVLSGTLSSPTAISGFGPGSTVTVKIYGSTVFSDSFDIYADNILSTPIDGTVLGAYQGGGYAFQSVSADYNVGIGSNSGMSLYNGTKNFFMGDNVAVNLTTGSYNFFMGHDTANNITQGNNNVSIMSNFVRDGTNNQVGIGAVLYYDGVGNLLLNANTTVGENADATSITTGGLVVNGGMGISGDIWLGGNIIPDTAASSLGTADRPFTKLHLTGQTLYLGTITFKSSSDTSMEIESIVGPVSVLTGGLHLNNGVQSTSTTTGSLLVDGGVGIGGNLYLHGDLYSTDAGSVILQPSGRIRITSGQAGSIDNMEIGAGTPQDGHFLNLYANSINASTVNALTSTATNLAGGAAGSLPYQSTVSNTAMLPLGTAGYILTSNGTHPVWTNPSVIASSSSTNASNASNIYINPTASSTPYYIALSETIGNFSPIDSTLSFTYDTTYGTLSVPNLSVTGTTASTSTTTGAVVVTGGVGVGGSVHSQDGNVNEGNLLYSPNVTIGSTPPPNPRVGAFWLDTSAGVEYQYVQDGDNRFWLQFAGI